MIGRACLSILAGLALIAAAPGDVQVRTSRAADGSHILIHETVVAAPPSEVWAAISTAEGWKTWAVPAAWASGPDIIETSYDAFAKPGDKSTIRQQLIAKVPRRRLVFRTVKAPAGFPNFATYAKVTSRFELSPAGRGKTRVRLTGAGYADTEAGRKLLAFFKSGNAQSLEWLRSRFEKGPRDWKRHLPPAAVNH